MMRRCKEPLDPWVAFQSSVRAGPLWSGVRLSPHVVHAVRTTRICGEVSVCMCAHRWACAILGTWRKRIHAVVACLRGLIASRLMLPTYSVIRKHMFCTTTNHDTCVHVCMYFYANHDPRSRSCIVHSRSHISHRRIRPVGFLLFFFFVCLTRSHPAAPSSLFQLVALIRMAEISGRQFEANSITYT